MSDQHKAILEAISEKVTVMLASAQEHRESDSIVGYTIKTGALHSIIGILTGAGAPVALPKPRPISDEEIDDIALDTIFDTREHLGISDFVQARAFAREVIKRAR